MDSKLKLAISTFIVHALKQSFHLSSSTVSATLSVRQANWIVREAVR